MPIDAAHFPDEYFREYVSDEFDTDNNGSLSKAEIKAATDIWLDGSSVRSLKGIEYFTSLRLLSCYDARLTTLDVSKNTKLEALDCGNNELTSLNVTKNTKLRMLYCDNNELTALNVTKNTELTHLVCDNNQLTSLAVNKNTKLEYLSCSDNELTKLSLTKNTALTQLYCQGNQLTALNVTKNTALKHLFCYKNQLTALDVSKNTALERLVCYKNQLSTLDVSKNAALKYLDCYDNQITALNVSNSPALWYLDCYDNQLTTLDLTKNTALLQLYCGNNKLTTLDVSRSSALWYLDCSRNQLTTLDLPQNVTLRALFCAHNRLATLDLSNIAPPPPVDGYEYNFFLGYQAVSPLYVTNTEDSSYPYQLDFGMYMSSKDVSNVYTVKAFTSNDAKISTSFSNGVVQFASLPAKVTYNYFTGYSYRNAKTIEVTISGTPVKPSISSKFPNGTVGVKYSKSVTVSGNTAPYTWSKSGTLPTGLKLKYSGAKATLSGTPTEAGTFKFKLKVAGKDGVSVTKTFTVKITAASSTSKSSSGSATGSPSGTTSGMTDEETQAEQTKNDTSSSGGTSGGFLGDSQEGLEGENTDVSLRAELSVVSDDIVEVFEGKDSDMVKVKAGEPLRFEIGDWGTEVDNMVVYVDDKPMSDVQVSDKGEFTLPAEVVHDDFKVGVKAKSVSGKELESQELYIIAE